MSAGHISATPPSSTSAASLPAQPANAAKVLFARKTVSVTSQSAGVLPTTASSSVRVVGRGGQGSRPRNLPDTAPGHAHSDSQASISSLAAISQKRAARPDITRIVGRGGMGSRPRDLPASAPTEVTLPGRLEPGPVPARPQQSDADTELPPVLYYRPSGRGGAGSRPRKVKAKTPAPVEPADADRANPSPRLLWKGKGKKDKGKERDLPVLPRGSLEPGAASSANTALVRTDTFDSLASSVQFASPVSGSPERSRYQSTVSQDREDGDDVVVRASSRMNWQKLARKLGMGAAADGVPERSSTSTQRDGDDARAGRVLRRSSISGFSASTPPRPYASDAEKARRRRSSFESLPQQLYPTPPRPPEAFPSQQDYEPSLEDDDADDDGQSDVLTGSIFDGTSTALTDDTSSDAGTISSTSTRAPLVITPGGKLAYGLDGDEDDSDYHWDRSPTPTQMLHLYESGRDKHLSSVPFEGSAVPLSLWESSDHLEAVVRDERTYGWSGEWNRADIRDVIGALRQLRM